MGVIRSWQCLNGRCSKEFESWEPNPSCPSCGGVRVNWIPGGGHVAGTSRAADAELRTLADTFGMTDINTARRGERAKPALPSAPAAERGAPAVTFGPGFSSPVVRDRSGAPVATCLPSSSPVDFKVKAGRDRPMAPNKSFAHISSNTRVEARHSG